MQIFQKNVNKLSHRSSTTFTGRKPYISMEPSTVSLLVLLPLVLNPHEESDPCQGRQRAQTQPQLAVTRTHFQLVLALVAVFPPSGSVAPVVLALVLILQPTGRVASARPAGQVTLLACRHVHAAVKHLVLQSKCHPAIFHTPAYILLGCSQVTSTQFF